MVKAMEKAPVMDLDKVCRFQSPQLESDQIWGARCSSLLLWMEDTEGEGNGGLSMGLRAAVGLGRSSPLSRDASYPSRAVQPREQNPGGFRP